MDTPPTPSLTDGVAILVISWAICIFLCIDGRTGFFVDDEKAVCLLFDTGDNEESWGDLVWNGLTFAVGRLWCELSDWWEILFNIERLLFWLNAGGGGGAGVGETGAPS